MKRVSYQDAIAQLGLLDALIEYNPVLIGTPPLGISTDKSDIDIACSSTSLREFAKFSKLKFGHHEDFEMLEIQDLTEPACVAKFSALDWEFELFCQALPTSDQWGVRHFYIEQRLLGLSSKLIRDVTELKQNGLKTEPAFAQLLLLEGDPYQAILDLETYSDEALLSLIYKYDNHQ